MILIDTGYFLALLNPPDALHTRAHAWAARVKEELVVTEYVLWETANSSSNPMIRARVHALVARVRSGNEYEFLLASSQLFDAGLRLQAQRPDKYWSLTDCILFVVMQSRGISRALAHDHHFEQAGFEALLRREPDP